jgi:hypothetical protein
MPFTVRVRAHRLVKAINGYPAECAVTHGQSRTHWRPPKAHLIVLFEGLNDAEVRLTSRQIHMPQARADDYLDQRFEESD